MAASPFCCRWFHVSAKKGLWQISAVGGTGVELWRGPCFGATEVKMGEYWLEDRRLKSPSRSVLGQGHVTVLPSIMTGSRCQTRRPHTHTHTYVLQHILYVHLNASTRSQRANTQRLHDEELLGSIHPRLFPIITISFNNNNIKWQDEILHDNT